MAARSPRSRPAGQSKYLEGFGPKVQGFDQIPITDLAAVEAAIGPETAAIMIEPIQGEGGVRVVDRAFLRGLREICDRDGLLLIFDEVQTGVGRTGKLFAYEHLGRYARHPDLAPRASAAASRLAPAWRPPTPPRASPSASHGTTFGGNPLAMAIGNAVLDVVLAPGFLENVARLGLAARQKLAALKDAHPEDHRGGARRGPDDRPQARRFRPAISRRWRATRRC